CRTSSTLSAAMLTKYDVVSGVVKALSWPPLPSTAGENVPLGWAGVPLNIFCSRKWARPVAPGRSSREPTRYHTCTDTRGLRRSSRMSTRRPLSRVASRRGVAARAAGGGTGRAATSTRTTGHRQRMRRIILRPRASGNRGGRRGEAEGPVERHHARHREHAQRRRAVEPRDEGAREIAQPSRDERARHRAEEADSVEGAEGAPEDRRREEVAEDRVRRTPAAPDEERRAEEREREQPRGGVLTDDHAHREHGQHAAREGRRDHHFAVVAPGAE